MGASRLTIAAEIGANWVGDLPEQSVQRYGRNPTYGMGYFNPIPLARHPGAADSADAVRSTLRRHG